MRKDKTIVPVNSIDVSKSRILANIKILKKKAGKACISPVLKSNAFGHGLELVGEFLDPMGFPFFCVASLEEAIRLRKHGIKTDIFIMGYIDPKNLKAKKWDFSFALFDIDQLKALPKGSKVHLVVETGLHREGIEMDRFERLLKEKKLLSKCKVEGLMSHFACSNDPGCKITKIQLANYKKAKAMVSQGGYRPEWYHAGGSLALLNNLVEDYNLVRCGKALFGIGLQSSYTSGAKRKGKARVGSFDCALNLKTKIGQVKKVKKGDHVGYADAFIAKNDMTIGILPIGYTDGIDRRLSNKGLVRVKNTYCRFLGVIAMNVSIVDLSKVKSAKAGDDVVIYSKDISDPNSFDNSAIICGTLPHELLVHLSSTINRKLI